MEFNQEAFDEEYPVIDPFAERVNSRETAEPIHCWVCQGIYDRVSGERIGDADPNGEEVSSMREACAYCNSVSRYPYKPF